MFPVSIQPWLVSGGARQTRVNDSELAADLQKALSNAIAGWKGQSSVSVNAMHSD